MCSLHVPHYQTDMNVNDGKLSDEAPEIDISFCLSAVFAIAASCESPRWWLQMCFVWSTVKKTQKTFSLQWYRTEERHKTLETLHSQIIWQFCLINETIRSIINLYYYHYCMIVFYTFSYWPLCICVNTHVGKHTVNHINAVVRGIDAIHSMYK